MSNLAGTETGRVGVRRSYFRPGRRGIFPLSNIPSERRKRIRVAFDLIVRQHTHRDVARLHGISVSTVYTWVRKVLSPEFDAYPEAVDVRRVYHAMQRERSPRAGKARAS